MFDPTFEPRVVSLLKDEEMETEEKHNDLLFMIEEFSKAQQVEARDIVWKCLRENKSYHFAACVENVFREHDLSLKEISDKTAEEIAEEPTKKLHEMIEKFPEDEQAYAENIVRKYVKEHKPEGFTNRPPSCGVD